VPALPIATIYVGSPLEMTLMLHPHVGRGGQRVLSFCKKRGRCT